MKSDGDIDEDEDEVPRFCKLVCTLSNVIMTLAATLPNSYINGIQFVEMRAA